MADELERTKPVTRETAIREPILAAAVELFRNHGFAGTSMQDIATAAGLSRPALYYHFKNKEEILRSLVEVVTVRTQREAARIASTATSDHAELLRAVVFSHAVSLLRHPQHFAVLQRDERHLPARVQALQEKAKRELFDTFSHLIRSGVSAGMFRECDPVVTAFCIFGMCSWTVQWFKPGGKMSADKVAEIIADNAVSMVRRNGGAGDLSPASWLAVIKDDIAHLERVITQKDGAKRS